MLTEGLIAWISGALGFGFSLGFLVDCFHSLFGWWLDFGKRVG